MLLKRSLSIAVVLLVTLSVTACGMSHRGRNTAIGAGVGAAGGTVPTGGITFGTLVGAAICINGFINIRNDKTVNLSYLSLPGVY